MSLAKRVALLLPNGYEEMEMLAVVDLLRRADCPVDLISITGSLETIGDHQVIIRSDLLLSEAHAQDYLALVTPGGKPGTEMLCAEPQVLEWIQAFLDEGKWVACICASPLVLEAAQRADRYKGTCYPGFERLIRWKEYSSLPVCRDRNLITSQGPATALAFALELVEVLKGPEIRSRLEAQLLYR